MKKLWAALATTGVLGASLVALAPAASAAPQACVTTTITTGYRTYSETASKSSTSTCSDLNLTYANDTSAVGYDCYRGMYRNSAGTWFRGTSGWHCLDDGAYAVDTVLLLTDLNDGTTFGVESYYDAPDYVNITH
ncbi:hypothetical protein JCM4814A_37200 [Streptomyces phaeofaciens JCM 4814]|uniref:Secreted protein n=1 Tax=Streptomyces phaeofaciens TaxID=68254 RepID=A0A918HFX2_9ACTN|nr:hypothetical protein [Streptomyces phaeofaciens]GGT59004.1 hypothetical protein GCM10010226_40360 [Streptomyces phaeofaciens]